MATAFSDSAGQPAFADVTGPLVYLRIKRAVATLPEGYVIGAEDVLVVTFWRDKELSGEVVVRPDGKISLPLLNDVQAAGYTPEQLAGVV